MNVTGIGVFPQLVNTASSLVKMANPAASRFVDVVNAMTSRTSTVGIDPDYRDLIEKQMQFQQQMQRVSMETNVSRTEHETRMSVVRNVRVA